MASIINASTSSGLVQTADTSGQLQLQTNGTAAVTVDASQNVGIGTTSPSTQLQVSGTNAVLNITRSTKNIYVNPNYANGGVYGTLEYDLAMAFNTNGAERMRIDSSGNVLFGNTSSNVTSGGFAFFPSSASTFDTGHSSGTSSGAKYTGYYYNGTQIGSITQSGTTATAYNTSSDYRLKENIAPMVGALEIVSKLNPVTYTWKADGSYGQGFIAHELQAVVPDCVTGKKDAVDKENNPIYQGIDTSFLVATLTAAIQEQTIIINDLKARITALEGAK